MDEVERPPVPEAVQASAWIGLFALTFLALRGTLALLLVPGVVLALIAVVGLLAASAHGALALERRLAERIPSQRLLWLLPMVDLALTFVTIAVPLGLPSWRGDHEFWKDALGLPPTPFTRLVMTVFVLIGFQVAYVFVKLVARFLADPRSWQRASGDGVTSMVCVIGLVALGCLLLYGQAHLRHNVLYVKGWMALSLSARPAQAIAHFAEVVKDYKSSGLADGCLYRMARVQIEELGETEEGIANLRRLLAEPEFATSPFRDDALNDLGELALKRGDAVEAEARFAELAAQFPRSYLAERAAIGRARALALAGRGVEAREVLARLEAGGGRPRIVSESEGAIVVEPLRRAIERVREKLRP